MSGYKHIVWVDDFDNKNISLSSIPSDEEWDLEDDIGCPGENHRKDVEDNFGDCSDQVQLITSIPQMVDYIDNNLEKCDCIVLDVNLRKSLNDEQRKSVSESCKRKGIRTDRDLGQHGGYYLYLYLLKSGFPADNICMFTGNKGEDNTTGLWERRFREAGMYPPESINRNEPKELQKWIHQIYGKEYYRIRLLVYQACEYWKGELAKLPSEEIAFNRIYHADKNGFRVEACSFIDMLDRVEMLFPLTQPSNCNRLYYQALQAVAMFHEESAELKALDKAKYSDIRKYHCSVRNFRNWSAHNQFSGDEMDGRLFAYLFCVALRTYFGKCDGQFSVEPGNNSSVYSAYEKEYFENVEGGVFEFEAFREKYRNAFHRHMEKVKNYGDKKIKSWEYKDFNSLLMASGRCRVSGGTKMLFSDILLSITDDWIIQEDKKEDYSRNELKYTYSCSYKWREDKLDWDDVKREDFFRAYAYLMVCVM